MNAITSNSMFTCPSSPCCSSLVLAIATNSSQKTSSTYFSSQRLFFPLQERAAISRPSLFSCFLLHNHQGYHPTHEHALNSEENADSRWCHLGSCVQGYSAMELTNESNKEVIM